jgi:hypothetical protein
MAVNFATSAGELRLDSEEAESLIHALRNVADGVDVAFFLAARIEAAYVSGTGFPIDTKSDERGVIVHAVDQLERSRRTDALMRFRNALLLD